jgi:L-ascorbate metabolism protein UlaG (beta-lactamase superfamily)
MRLTKYTHACVRLEKDTGALAVDPGIWSEPEALQGAAAVLVTHAHFDHFDAEALRAAAGRDPDLTVVTNQQVAADLSDLGERVRVVKAGDQLDVAGFDVRVFGGQHAMNHLDIPVVANVAFLFDGAVLHPGDSFTVPNTDVTTLLVPTSAPWLKMAEAVDFVRSVRPRRAFSIHDGLVNERGAAVVDNNLRVLTEPFGVDYRRLAPGESVQL